MNQYDDILRLPHFHEKGRDYMSMEDRAAQFAPYKSLVGYEELIETKTNEILDTKLEEIIYDEGYLEFDDLPQ